MTLVMTSLPLVRVASMFVYIRARFRLALIGGSLTAQNGLETIKHFVLNERMVMFFQLNMPSERKNRIHSQD